jgi:hypothetical protein
MTVTWAGLAAAACLEVAAGWRAETVTPGNPGCGYELWAVSR